MRTNVYFENVDVRHHSAGQSVGRKIILNWILKEEVVMVLTGFSVLVIESSWLLGSRWPEYFVNTVTIYRVLKNAVSYFMF